MSKKRVIFAFVNLQQIKGVIANEHEKLNRLMITKFTVITRQKLLKSVHDSRIVAFSRHSMTEETQFLGFMFPQIMQRH